jgi:DNA-binding NtrC family response regulator
MTEGVELQSSFLQHLLVFASHPATQLDGLLQFILVKALAVTSSDAGGGIFIVDLSKRETSLVGASLCGEWADTPANLVRTWMGHPGSAAALVLRSNQPYGVSDHRQDAASFPLLLKARSSLWVPLVDGWKAIGFLHVASSQPRHYREQQVRQLVELATGAVPAIRRFLLNEQLLRGSGHLGVIGVNPAFLEIERQIKLASAHPKAPVLITGERGSGKELAAWAIHFWSDRRDRPFVPVLASAFAETLFAAELFGHERHAFTGAHRERLGKFKAADGGTLFFDEVADISPAIQSALLRVVEQGEIHRIGRDLPLHVDVRVIAATNQDLRGLMQKGRFREDLYDRLRVFEIRMPPLRERREDILLLASHFLRQNCLQLRQSLMGEDICASCSQGARVGCATLDFYQMLRTYDWPGNVRELENLVLRLIATVPNEILDAKHLPEEVRCTGQGATAEPKNLTLHAMIKRHIERVLRITNDNQSAAADILGIPLSTLRSKMKKCGIEMEKPPSGRPAKTRRRRRS